MSSVVIRLQRHGARKNPHYLIVAMNRRQKREGEYLEKLGFYSPKEDAATDRVKLDLEKVKVWQAKGAQLSETVGHLVKSITQ